MRCPPTTSASTLARLIEKHAAWLLLGIFALLCFASQRHKSVTVDEFSHFPSGIYNLVTGDWRMDRESPPLVKCLPGLTALAAPLDLDLELFRDDPNTWGFGYSFMFQNQEAYRDVFRNGRCVVILLAALGGWILFRFARALYGPRAALFVLFLYVFNPNVIAHSRLTTIDMGATAAMLGSVFGFWFFLQRRDGGTALLAGALLGLAQLSKFTALLLYPLFALLFAASLVRRKPTSLPMSLAWFAALVLTSLLVTNAGYLFAGSLTPLGEFAFESDLLQGIASVLPAGLPVPLPYEYLAGFDAQLAISAGGNPFYAGYLLGERSVSGWWYYYLVAFAVKNPEALLVLLAATAFAWIRWPRERPGFDAGLCIWGVALAFVAYFSFFTSIPIGVRYLLPVFPLLFLATGHLARSLMERGAVARTVLGVLAAAYLVPTLLAFPDYLSYFNRASGGSANGQRWLIMSNLDWGQDLPRLKRTLDARGLETVHLGYFGRVDPRLYGIDFTLSRRVPQSGLHAISVNYLVGRPYYALRPDRSVKEIDLDTFAAYRKLTPAGRVGDTFFLFEVP